MKRIQLSKRPFFFGLNLLFFPNKPILYFDRQFLYAESRKEQEKYPIETITHVRNTWSKINHQTIWEIDGRASGKFYSFRFITKQMAGYDPIDALKGLLEQVNPNCVFK